MNMCNTCSGVSGLLVLLGGLSLLGFGLGYLEGSMGHVASGVFFSLYGLAVLAHAGGMCPNCKMPMRGR